MHVYVLDFFLLWISNEIQHMKQNPQHGKNVSNCVDPISYWPAVSEPIRHRTPWGRQRETKAQILISQVAFHSSRLCVMRKNRQQYTQTIKSQTHFLLCRHRGGRKCALTAGEYCVISEKHA